MNKAVFGAGVVSLSVCFLTSPARSDKPTGLYMEQSCAWSDPPIAAAALKHLKVGNTVQFFCKTCGDTMSTPVSVTKSEVVATEVAMKQVNMNGGMLDLALVYVQPTANGPWVNLSKLVKCGTPTANPNTLPSAMVSPARPGALPSWWQAMQ